MTNPKEKTREELQAEIEDGKKKIRQFENREKMLRQKLSKEERRTRSHRLIVRGAVFESIVPEAKNMTDEEAAHHNAVFVGRDEDGVPRYAHQRGTAGNFRLDVKGSDKAFNFCYRGEGERLFVFEAPIDLLSFLCLFKKDWQKQSYLALGGVGDKALMCFLSDRPNIKTVYLCLDSDQAGNDACSRLVELMPEDLTVHRLIPLFKDWNEVQTRRNEITDGKYLREAVYGLKEPVYEKTVASHSQQDWGDTYVEVDLSTQHMWYIVNGSVQLETDIVTGLASDPNRATPSGVYSILEMKRDKVLTGETNPSTGEPIYRTKVSYWMRVTWTGIGFHDAIWQSAFGGNRYQTSAGSHGCINMPLDQAASLYDMLEMGTPVVIHE